MVQPSGLFEARLRNCLGHRSRPCFVAGSPALCLFMHDVMDVDSREFKLGYDLKTAYLHKLSPNNYIPLGNVLDLETSLPGLVSRVDFREFYTNNAHVNIHPWAIEANASHFDTNWIQNQSDLEGSQEEIVVTEHQVQLRYNRTFRDIARFLERSPFNELSVWSLLDSHRVSIHDSVYRNGIKSSFRPRFRTKILAASRAIWRDRWQGIPYASIHIRGSDGHFESKKTKTTDRFLIRRFG